MTWRHALACLILLASAIHAAPLIRDIAPHGAQRGKTFTLTLRGEDLAPGARIQTTLPASISRLIPQETMRPNSELPFLVELKADAPVGLYPLRIITADGLSNVMLFSVGTLPECEESESKDPKKLNDKFEDAEPLMVPSTTNGTLTSGDIDIYGFEAKAGQKLTFEVEARRVGSAIDPALEIFDATGRELAKNDDGLGIGVDARLQWAAPKTGRYFVRVHDSRYSNQSQNFYRLKVGSFEYAEALFPLGGRRGEAASVALFRAGQNTPVATVKADTAAKGPVAFVNPADSAALPLPFTLSEEEELLKPVGPASTPALLKEHAIMNGRISSPGAIDKYTLNVEPGQKWVFDLTAASLGTSQLDAILTVYDAAGKKLASRDDTNGVDPILPFTVPESVRAVTIAVEDVLGRGGPEFGYRLQARRQAPDFTVELLTPYVNIPAGGTAQVPVLVRRHGHDGAVQIKITNLPPGFKLAGGHVPPENADQSFNTDNMGFRSARSTLTITAPAAATEVFDLGVIGEADTPEGKITRTAVGPGLMTAVRGDRQKPFTAPWLGFGLPVAVSKPALIELSTPKAATRIAQGVEFPIEYHVQRKAGVKAPVKVRTDVAGSVGNIRILKGAQGDSGSFLLATNFSTPATTFDMVLEGQTEIDGRPVTISAPMITVQVVPGYSIELQGSLNADGTTRGTVRREPTFEGGLVRIQADDLPDGVKCVPVEVPADQTEFSLVCTSAPDAHPGSYPVRLVSSAPNTGHKAKEEYKIADIETKLLVPGVMKAAK